MVPATVDCSTENTVVVTSDDSDVELVSDVREIKYRDLDHVQVSEWIPRFTSWFISEI